MSLLHQALRPIRRSTRRGPRLAQHRQFADPRRHRPGRAGGLDVRGPRALEPARDHHPELKSCTQTIAIPLWLTIHRRAFLRGSTTGLGTLALASLLDPSLLRGGRPQSRPASPHASPSAGAAWSIPSISLPRSSGSSISTWPAARRTWRRSTISRHCRNERAADARVVHPRHADRPAPGGETGLPRSPAPVSPLRPERPGDEHDLPPPGHGRRRPLHHPLHGDRGDQPRPCPHLHEYGHHDLGPAGDGLMDQLRAGKRKRQSARIRRPDLRRPLRTGPADRVAAMA